jgi:hypothetical protein
MQTASEYDLGSMLGAERRSDRGYTIAGLVIAAIGILGLIGGVVRGIQSGFVVQTVVLLVAGPAIFVLGVLVSTLWARMSIKTIRLTPKSIEVVRPDGRRKSVDWMNPKLRIYLWDRSAVNGNSRSVKGQPSPYFAGFTVISASSPVTKDLYEAILLQAKQHELSVSTDSVKSGDDAGAVRTIVAGRG